MEFPEKLTIPSHTIELTGRYSETDQAGIIHHSVYPIWFEMGRTELLRVNKVTYKNLEAAGVFFVIAELEVKYRKPARYDEKLQLLTTCSEVTRSKIEHTYKLTRDDVLIAQGRTILACVSSQGKIRRIPEFMHLRS